MIRKIQLLVATVILVVAAFSTALPFLFYLLYLAILVIGGSYILVRLGLTDLEAGYAVSQLHGHVGDQVRVTYTLRNGSRIAKPWQLRQLVRLNRQPHRHRAKMCACTGIDF